MQSIFYLDPWRWQGCPLWLYFILGPKSELWRRSFFSKVNSGNCRRFPPLTKQRLPYLQLDQHLLLAGSNFPRPKTYPGTQPPCSLVFCFRRENPETNQSRYTSSKVGLCDSKLTRSSGFYVYLLSVYSKGQSIRCYVLSGFHQDVSNHLIQGLDPWDLHHVVSVNSLIGIFFWGHCTLRRMNLHPRSTMQDYQSKSHLTETHRYLPTGTT